MTNRKLHMHSLLAPRSMTLIWLWIGFPSNGDVIHYTSPSSYQPARSTRSSASHLYFLFRDITLHLALSLFMSLHPKYGTLYLFTSVNPKYTLLSDVILRHTTFTQPILPHSSPRNMPWFSSESLVSTYTVSPIVSSKSMRHRKMVSFPTSHI